MPNRLNDALMNIGNDFGPAHQSASLNHRILGICALLLDYDKKSFFEHCSLAGQYRLKLLKKLSVTTFTIQKIL